MRKRGYRESAIKGHLKSLKGLRCNLDDPEEVFRVISERNIAEGAKEKLVNIFLKIL